MRISIAARSTPVISPSSTNYLILTPDFFCFLLYSRHDSCRNTHPHPVIVAPSRGLSPVRSSLSARPSAKMPSPRTSPALRPTSPLSPRYESPRFDSLNTLQSSPRSTHSRAGNNTRIAHTNSLKLPSLPRFHPANFPSGHSSYQSTPDGNASPQPPVSPRAHHRMYSDAQKQLLMYQRGSIAVARASSPGGEGKPVSPRLAPLGSPGPVTPLELERDGGYLMAGAHQGGKVDGSADELVDRMIREESRRTSRSGQANGGTKTSNR